MKVVRDAEKFKGQVRHLEGVIAESDMTFAKLERDLMQATKVPTCMLHVRIFDIHSHV